MSEKLVIEFDDEGKEIDREIKFEADGARTQWLNRPASRNNSDHSLNKKQRSFQPT